MSGSSSGLSTWFSHPLPHGADPIILAMSIPVFRPFRRCRARTARSERPNPRVHRVAFTAVLSLLSCVPAVCPAGGSCGLTGTLGVSWVTVKKRGTNTGLEKTPCNWTLKHWTLKSGCQDLVPVLGFLMLVFRRLLALKWRFRWGVSRPRGRRTINRLGLPID